MSQDSRYELLERVGIGSFATVYRARDAELGREVAIKQIHEQYMHLPEQMERYWQEAQLLASLQHPNIITFFDIDRKRGWLIMELMQGNLAVRIAQEPLDLGSVRTALAHCLRALKYLHSRGIVHGDIKPSNLMIDARKRVKIGDFGLARRVSNEEGSLLKGTTKYMAPETVSDEFGDVGPASDLYSLGFSAYELMCGPNFETLFPGLSAFGRDKQLAWMMWHAAKDRRLPEIHRVLHGVPDDLAHVVQKLCEKDPTKRYQSADEALSDLNIDLKIIKQGSDEPKTDPAAGRRRIIAISAFCASLVLSGMMLFLTGRGQTVEQVTTQTEPDRGVLRHVLLDEAIIAIDAEPDGIPKEIALGANPKILLNEKTYITARELQKGDRLVIRQVKDDAGRSRLEIDASRPDESIGFVSDPQPQIGQFILRISEGPQRGELAIRTTAKTEVLINGRTGRADELLADDVVTVRHIPDAKLVGARIATRIDALQKQKLEGFVRGVDAQELTVEVRERGATALRKLSVAGDCNVTLNGKQIVEGRVLRIADLRPGDRVTLKHHKDVIEAHALRQSLFKGPLLELNLAASSLTVGAENDGRKVFAAGQTTTVTIEGQSAALADLRRNDRLEITYDSASEGGAVSVIDAVRPDHENRYAIVIGIQAYDDNRLTKLPFAVSDATLVHAALLHRYACSPERTLLLTDETHVRLTQAIPDWLKKTNAQSELLVYFVGHAYLDDQGQPYLAAKDFDSTRVRETGISLAWLRSQLEDCPAGEKVLLLDCCHFGEGQDLTQQPSTDAMLRAIKPAADPEVFRRTYGIASCSDAQRGLVLAEKKHGAFAWFVAEALSGHGDKNSDLHLEPTELFDFLSNQLVAVEVDKRKQTPVLFRPNDAPPPKSRVSPEGQDAVRNFLANHWGVTRLSSATDLLLANDLLAATRLLSDEPDAKLAYAVVRLKVRNDDKESQKYFEQVRLSHPKLRLSFEGLAWNHAYSGRHRDALNVLLQLCEQLRASEPAGDSDALRVLEFAGRLREYAATIAEEPRRPDSNLLMALDGAVERLGPEAKLAFEAGRKSVGDKLLDYDLRIKSQAGSADAKLLELEQKRLTSYARFDFDAARQAILAGLER